MRSESFSSSKYCPISPIYAELGSGNGRRRASPSLGKYCPISRMQEESVRSKSLFSGSNYCPRELELERSESLGKYCPTSPFYEQLERSDSPFSGKHCPISSVDPELERPDSHGSTASATHCSDSLKRRRLEDSVMEGHNGDSGFDGKIPPERVINVREFWPPSFSELLRYHCDSGFDGKNPSERVINLSELVERRCPTSFTELVRACEEEQIEKKNVERPRKHYKFMETGDATTHRRQVMAMRANFMNGLLLNNNKTKKKETTPIATLAKDSDQLTKLKDLMLRWGKLEEAQSQLDRDRAKLIQEQAQLIASLS